MGDESNYLFTFLEGMNTTRWMVFGFALLVLEVLTGTTYILWPAAAALIVGLIVLVVPLAWPMQMLLFALISVGLLFYGHNKVVAARKARKPSDLNERAKSMVGKRVKAVVDFDAGEGRVQVGDTQWRAAMEEGNAKTGDELRIVSVKGTTLYVVPA